MRPFLRGLGRQIGRWQLTLVVKLVAGLSPFRMSCSSIDGLERLGRLMAFGRF